MPYGSIRWTLPLARGAASLMESTYLFLDTEWADLPGVELVSLGLISADGRHQFYAERDPLPCDPTAFVCETVYPLLERGRAAMRDAEFTMSLRSFLRSMPRPSIVYDYPNDGALLHTAIAGFRLLPIDLAKCEVPPADLQTMYVKDDLTAMILEDWFLANPQEAERRHHALVDARALRIAWLASNGKIDAEWSPFWRRQKSAR